MLPSEFDSLGIFFCPDSALLQLQNARRFLSTVPEEATILPTIRLAILRCIVHTGLTETFPSAREDDFSGRRLPRCPVPLPLPPPSLDFPLVACRGLGSP